MFTQTSLPMSGERSKLSSFSTIDQYDTIRNKIPRLISFSFVQLLQASTQYVHQGRLSQRLRRGGLSVIVSHNISLFFSLFQIKTLYRFKMSLKRRRQSLLLSDPTHNKLYPTQHKLVNEWALTRPTHSHCLSV